LETEQNARIGYSNPISSSIEHILINLARGDQSSDRIDEALERNLRELIKLDNEILGLLKSTDGDNDICTQINILSALRSSDDTPTSTSRATSVGKSQRERPSKQRKLNDNLDDRDSMIADSPGPSPKVAISQKDKLIAKSASSRSGSVPVGREGSVKAEDDDNGKGKKSRSSLPRSSSSSSKRGFAR
jgi:SAGA-associated factor 29